MADGAGRWDLREYSQLMGMIGHIGGMMDAGKRKKEDELIESLYPEAMKDPQKVLRGEYSFPENTPPRIQREVSALVIDDFGKKLTMENEIMRNEAAKWDKDRDFLLSRYNGIMSGNFEENKAERLAQLGDIVNKLPVPYQMSFDPNKGLIVRHEMDIDGKEPQIIPPDQINEQTVRERLEPILDPQRYREFAYLKQKTDYAIKQDEIANPYVFANPKNGDRIWVSMDYKNFDNSLISFDGKPGNMTVGQAREKGVDVDQYVRVGRADAVEDWDRQELAARAKDERKRRDDYKIGVHPLMNNDGEMLYLHEKKDSHGNLLGYFYSADRAGQKIVSEEAAEGYQDAAAMKEIFKMRKAPDRKDGMKIIDDVFKGVETDSMGAIGGAIQGTLQGAGVADQKMATIVTFGALMRESKEKAPQENMAAYAIQITRDADKEAGKALDDQMKADPNFAEKLKNQNMTPDEYRSRLFYKMTSEKLQAAIESMAVPGGGEKKGQGQFPGQGVSLVGGDQASIEDIKNYAKKNLGGKTRTAALGGKNPADVTGGGSGLPSPDETSLHRLQENIQTFPADQVRPANPQEVIYGMERNRPAGSITDPAADQMKNLVNYTVPKGASYKRLGESDLQQTIREVTGIENFKELRDFEENLRARFPNASDEALIQWVNQTVMSQVSKEDIGGVINSDQKTGPVSRVPIKRMSLSYPIN